MSKDTALQNITGTESIIHAGSDAVTFFESVMPQIETGLANSGYIVCSQQEAQTEWHLNIMQEIKKDGSITLKIINAGGGASNQTGQSVKVYAKKIDADSNRLNQLEREEEARARGRSLGEPLFK